MIAAFAAKDLQGALNAAPETGDEPRTVLEIRLAVDGSGDLPAGVLGLGYVGRYAEDERGDAQPHRELLADASPHTQIGVRAVSRVLRHAPLVAAAGQLPASASLK